MDFKILHTADLHLSKEKPNTMKALDEILRIAKRKKIDLLTIGGDLFNKDFDAEELRVDLREKFSGNKFKIIAIPGNHDAAVYRKGLDFGENFIPIIKEPFGKYSIDNINLIAIPFVEELSQELLELLKSEVMVNNVNILLIHCTLDIGFHVDDFGEEQKYCPITKAELEKLGYDYILAGHFHKKADIVNLNEDCTFIYPGSPTSITSRELGKRKVILIDFKSKKPKEIILNTFYYNSLIETVFAGKEDETIARIKKWLAEQIIYEKNIKVTVLGFIKKSEIDFRKSLEELHEEVAYNHKYKDVSLVLNDPLYVKFKDKLNESDFKNKEDIEEVVLKAASIVFSQERE